jgi:hypothetical protein
MDAERGDEAAATAALAPPARTVLIDKDQTNREIAGHLLAFARQFSADPKPA